MKTVRPNQVNPKITRTFGVDYASLTYSRLVLQQKIKMIEQRLSIGFSDPLHDYLMSLMKEDTQLLCRLIDISCP